MAYKLFEFEEQLMMDTSLLKLTLFEKTGSIGKTLISLENLIIISFFETRSRSRFSWPLHFCYSIVEFALLITKGIN